MLAPALVGGSGPVRLVTDRSGSDFEGIRLVVEALEPRVLLSIAASLAGPFQAAEDTPYTAYIHTTGTQSASSETFKFGDGTPGTVTITPPTQNPQPASNVYDLTNVGSEFAIKADVTPAGGGGMFTIPITNNSQFGGVGTANFTGKTVTPPANATGGQGYAIGGDGSGSLFVTGPFIGATDGRRVFAVSKFTAAGILDTTFDSDGTKEIDIPGNSLDVATDIEIIGTDLFVAGTSGNEWAVAKLNTGTGALDTTFDGDGIRTGFQTGTLNAVHINHHGGGLNTDMILSGATLSGAMLVYALNRSTGATNWSASVTFGLVGQYLWQEAQDIVVQGDGKVVAAGWACRSGTPGGTDFALARFNPDGTLDDGTPSDSTPGNSFGSFGKVTTNFGCLITGACHNPSFDTAYAVMESTDANSLYAVGKTNYNGPNQFAAVSYLQSDGSRDPDFKTTGLPNGLATGPDGIGYAGRVQPSDGKLVVGGAGTPGTTGSDFVVARFLTEQSQLGATGGALDTANFGLAGWIRTDFDKSGAYSSGHDVCRGIEIMSGGGPEHANAIVAGGFTAATSTSSDKYLALVEYLPKNKILVVGSGGSFLATPPPDGESPPPPDDPLATDLLDGEDSDDADPWSS